MASSQLSNAASISNPAFWKPRDKPPHPANKSMTLYLFDIITLLFFSIVKEVLYIYIKNLCDFIKCVQVWLNTILTPFTNRTCRLTKFISKPFTSFILFNQNHFDSIKISHNFYIYMNLVQRYENFIKRYPNV